MAAIGAKRLTGSSCRWAHLLSHRWQLIRIPDRCPCSIGVAGMTTYPAFPMPDSSSRDRVISARVHIVMLTIAAVSFGVVADLIAVLVSLALIWSTFNPV